MSVFSMGDSHFNATKSQYITFGGNRSMLSRIMSDNVEMNRVGKLKYLGCHFYERSCQLKSDRVFVSFMAILIMSCQ